MTDKREKNLLAEKPMGVRREISRSHPLIVRELQAAFDSKVPPAESAMWAAMSPDQRSQALKRLNVLLRLEAAPEDSSPEKAALDAGVSLTRWYEINAAWKNNRSLASLGTFATTPRTRKLANHDDLEELAVGVFDAAPTASVRQHALALGEAYAKKSGLPEKDLPSHNTLRKFAEAERRRRMNDEQLGSDVLFDCCACELPYSDEVFCAFLIIDKASRLVLGAGLDHPQDSRVGYAFAAANAQDRLVEPPMSGLRWANQMESSELVVGLDADSWSDIEEEMRISGLDGQMQPATAARRFGVFVRRSIGARMGRVKFVPGQTAKAADFGAPTLDQLIHFHAEVDAYNASLIEQWSATERRAPPPGLSTLLKRLTNN
ncbi:MAG: hypothetical protein ABIV36_17340 [Sphingobium limneticum]